MTPARLAGIGAFVIGGILLFSIGLFLIGERRMLFKEKFSVHTEFSRVSGLQVGAPVKVSGMPAGQVIAIDVPARASDKFRVRFSVREDLHALVRADSVASIQTEGLVGGTFLSVNAGTDQAARLPDEGTIPGREPFDMADLLQQMSDTVRMVNETIGALRGDVEKAVANVAETADKANALLDTVSDDVAAISESGKRVMADTQAVIEGLQQGRGTMGRLLKDDELYRRAAAIAQQAEGAMTEAHEAVRKGREAIEQFQSKDGPAQGLAADLRQTLALARATLANMEENSRALKRSFFFRGFFRNRGYYELDALSTEEYRNGALEGNSRRRLRIWLRADVLFAPTPDGGEELTTDGRARLDSAMGALVRYTRDAPLVVEGYGKADSRDLRYVRALARASMVREYVVDRFGLDATRTAIMPLGDRASGSPTGDTWDGIALAVFVERELLRSETAAGQTSRPGDGRAALSGGQAP